MDCRCSLVVFSFFIILVYVAVIQADLLSDEGLLADCYNPSGSTCDWYRQCFERKIPCQHTSYPYAVGFAEHYCKEYGKVYKKFTADGKKWIDAVRKCLQVELVPLMKSSKAMTCKEIQTYAFKSHVPCYHTPNPSQPQISFCNLPFVDWLRVTYTIKTSFVKVPLTSVHGAIGTLIACIKRGK